MRHFPIDREPDYSYWPTPNINLGAEAEIQRLEARVRKLEKKVKKLRKKAKA